jgi:hypothetical protein
MKIECRECGTTFEAKRAHAAFCCTQCRKAWNNRRAIRGAEFYDFIMADQYEREFRSELELRAMVSRLARAYRDSDKALRAGRKSWDVQEAFQRIPLGFSDEGDKR